MSWYNVTYELQILKLGLVLTGPQDLSNNLQKAKRNQANCINSKHNHVKECTLMKACLSETEIRLSLSLQYGAF